MQKTEEEPGKRGSQEGGANEIPKSALVKQETVQKTDKGITAKLKKYEQHTVGKVNSYTQKEGNLKSYEIDNTDICKYAGNAGKKNIQKEKLINSLEDKSEKVMLKILKKRKLKKEKKNVKNAESLQLHNGRKPNSSLKIIQPKDTTQTDDKVLIEDETQVKHPPDKPSTQHSCP